MLVKHIPFEGKHVTSEERLPKDLKMRRPELVRINSKNVWSQVRGRARTYVLYFALRIISRSDKVREGVTKYNNKYKHMYIFVFCSYCMHVPQHFVSQAISIISLNKNT